MNSQSIDLPIHWHFSEDEIQDLPGNATAGPKVSTSSALPLPNKDDLVSFEGMPGARFLVLLRHFEYLADERRPMIVHFHLSRLGFGG